MIRGTTEVIEVTFADNATVLAWLPPMRPPRAGGPRTLSSNDGIACRGAPTEALDQTHRLRRAGPSVRNTFLDDASTGTAPIFVTCGGHKVKSTTMGLTNSQQCSKGGSVYIGHTMYRVLCIDVKAARGMPTLAKLITNRATCRHHKGSG